MNIEVLLSSRRIFMFANNTLQAQWRLIICANCCSIKKVYINKECIYLFRIIITINSDWDLLCTQTLVYVN
jgi:hypothetical protein